MAVFERRSARSIAPLIDRVLRARAAWDAADGAKPSSRLRCSPLVEEARLEFGVFHEFERSLAASPLILAAAIAERTRRMRIGTAVQVLPLCHPLRLAEEAATVDQISHGRLIFGVGRSGFPRTYETYGVPYA